MTSFTNESLVISLAIATDGAFEKILHDYLAQFSEGEEPIVPLMYEELGGKLNRKKTLELDCYSGLRDKIGPEYFNTLN